MKNTTEYLSPQADVLAKTPKSAKKIPSLDLMKFIGILIVVFYHCLRAVNDTILTDPSPEQFALYGVMTLLGPCVPFFFLVNGYLLFDHKLDMKKQAKKTLHFYFLALLWSFVTIGLSAWEHPMVDFSLKYTIKHTILQDTRWYYHMWFMGTMVILYIFFPLLKSAWDHNRKGLYYFVGVCFLITFGNRALNMAYNVYAWLRYHVNYEPNYNFFSIFNPFQGFDGYVFVYFVLGAVIREHQERFNEIMKPWVCILGILVTTGALYLYGYFMSVSTGKLWMSGDRYGNDILFSLIRILCIFGLAGRYKGTGRFSKVVNYISANTMGIYLIHYVVRNLTLRTYKELVYIPDDFLQTLVYTAVVFAITLVILEIIKRIPVLKKIIT